MKPADRKIVTAGKIAEFVQRKQMIAEVQLEQTTGATELGRKTVAGMRRNRSERVDPRVVAILQTIAGDSHRRIARINRDQRIVELRNRRIGGNTKMDRRIVEIVHAEG